jgi:hypothetical protein
LLIEFHGAAHALGFVVAANDDDGIGRAGRIGGHQERPDERD